MNEDLRILLVDDHPIIIEGYRNTLMAIKGDRHFRIDMAHNCEDANRLLRQSEKEEDPYDVCFFDVSLPPSEDGLITSGEDLAQITRTYLPQARIVILTMINESYRIINIFKQLNPEGLLVKSDLTSDELADAFKRVMLRPPYYSSTVTSFLNANVMNDFYLDEANRKILYLLSKGVKTKNITKHVDLSLSAIEKRKKQLKALFSVEDSSDESLLKEAKKRGFL